MNTNYQTFLNVLKTENKLAVIAFVDNLMKQEPLELTSFYETYLRPTLQHDLPCSIADDEDLCIFEEHVRTNLIKLVMDYCTLYMQESYEKNRKQEAAIILCPSNELHDVGARMVADYFTLLGWDTYFAGANTPMEAVKKGIVHRKVKLVVVSISNYLNLSEGRRMVHALKKEFGKNIIVVIGGMAFEHNLHILPSFYADYYAKDLSDIEKISQEVTSHETIL
ncbi:MAG: cobalamin B12-binding domain-containing protein [Erysipelotrichaceae bacterium]